MSIRHTVASDLQEFPFDPEAGFWGQKAGERPCYHCLLSLRRDTRVVCVAEDDSKDCCILCEKDDKTCCAERLGAAQKIWNSYTTYICSQDKWTALQRWSIVRCIEECSTFFRVTCELLLRPYRTTKIQVIQAQEHASQRQIMALSYRVLAGEVHTPAEINANLAAAAPDYIVDCHEADELCKCLRLIDMCPDTETPHDTPTKTSLRFPEDGHSHVMSLVTCAYRTGAHAPQVTDCTPGQGLTRFGTA